MNGTRVRRSRRKQFSLTELGPRIARRFAGIFREEFPE